MARDDMETEWQEPCDTCQTAWQVFVTKYDSLISMELVSSDIIFPFLLWSINRVLDTWWNFLTTLVGQNIPRFDFFVYYFE